MNDYYEKCAFPKPKTTKKKKLYNGWKDKPNRVCEYTGIAYAERHEIFGASNRQKSIKYGLQMDLCHDIHERVTNPRTKDDIDLVQEMKQRGQRQFEDAMLAEGYTEVQARKTFMLEFGRNYLKPLGVEGV